MTPLILALLASSVFAYALVSGRARRWLVTPPMAFTALGLAVGAHGLGLVELELHESALHAVAELTLVLVLFADAARIDLACLRREHDLPERLLLAGLPLIAVTGTLAALVLFPDLALYEAALLAALLAPTDAALGEAVVTSRRVPVRIRQTLNVESGLNDGLVLPLVLLLISVACGVEGAEGLTYWLIFAVKQLTLGPLVGLAVGAGGAWLLDRAIRRGSMERVFRDVTAAALAVASFGVAELAGGNGFIAAFVGGLAFGNLQRASQEEQEAFAEAESQLLTLFVFLCFGAEMLPDAVLRVDARAWIYAGLSLTVVRLAPVALALLGKGLRWETVVFVSWFGPRGIATLLFALLVLEDAEMAGHDVVVSTAMVAVLLSVVLHGATAAPLARWYGERLGRTPSADGAEHVAVEAMPLRHSNT